LYTMYIKNKEESTERNITSYNATASSKSKLTYTNL